MGSPASRREGATFEIEFEGERLACVEGETIAATLVAHGRRAFSTDKQGRDRGLYCGMGVCHDCLVTVDGRSGERACVTRAQAGQSISRQDALFAPNKSALRDLAPLPSRDLAVRSVEVLVIGAGPAGMAAALAASQGGAQTIVLDERPSAGGQFYKQPASAHVQKIRPLDAQARAGKALIERVREAGAQLENGVLVWGAARDDAGAIEIMALAKGEASLFKPKSLIVATGAFERPTILPGWTLPGVMTTGAAQTLVRSYGVAPGRRIVVAGNGPLNLQVAAELAAMGSAVTVVEAAPAPWKRIGAGFGLAFADGSLAWQGLSLVARLRLAGVPVLWGHRLVGVDGQGRAERASVAPLLPNGDVDLGRARAIETDCVLTGEGFGPADELARLLGWRLETQVADARSEPGDVFVVGEAAGFGGAHIALAEGEIAGREAARRVERVVEDATRALRSLRRHQRFQKALSELFQARPKDLAALPDDAIICRCECVELGELKSIVSRREIRDLASLKRLTRAGMGRCQGRYCAPALADLFQFAHAVSETLELAPQIPLRPIPLAALAIEKSEWRGHKRTLLPSMNGAAGKPLEVTEIDTAIIGAGVVGISTALFLAQAGRECLVLDHSWPNSGASGGNAGSLHAQLLSFDFASGAVSDGGPAARTLPLQLESIRLWAQLQEELHADFEMKITGGLMLAEDEDDLARLKLKTRVERRYGVDCEVIGRAELRALEPALDERFVGAAYCPREGKINPLLATQSLLDAARRAGALVEPRTSVLAIERTSAGFLIQTQRGVVRARRLVNAAGGFASRIGAMLGLDVPVFGAPLQMIVTEAAEPSLSHLVAHAGRHLTLKQAANGNFLIGGGWTAGLDPVRHHPRPVRASLEGNLWIAQRVLPMLRKMRILRSWGAMNIDIDGAPIVGEHPAMPGFFNAVTANGYTLGPIMGKTTAELILTGHAELDISAFEISRFSSSNREARHD